MFKQNNKVDCRYGLFLHRATQNIVVSGVTSTKSIELNVNERYFSLLNSNL